MLYWSDSYPKEHTIRPCGGIAKNGEDLFLFS